MIPQYIKTIDTLNDWLLSKGYSCVDSPEKDFIAYELSFPTTMNRPNHVNIKIFKTPTKSTLSNSDVFDVLINFSNKSKPEGINLDYGKTIRVDEFSSDFDCAKIISMITNILNQSTFM